nr:hypothetical protein T459_08667 [Ipomoea trifida]
MSGNVHVRLREKGGDRNGLVVPHSRLQWVCSFFFGGVCQYDLNEVRGFASEIRWASLFRVLLSRRFCAINPSGRRLVVGGPAELSEKGSLSGGADTPARITGDSYKNGGEVNSTRRHSGMDVDPSGRDNHSGPGRSGDHSQETKKTELREAL